MATEQEVKALFEQLVQSGVNSSQLSALIKGAKADGKIVSKRGAAPSTDPIKLGIKDQILAVTGLLQKVIDAAKAVDGKSYMVKLTDDWSINFVKKVPRVKKAKVEKPAADLTEPSLA